MKKILTNNAPKPSGHYSQAVIHNSIMYISGQLPVKSGQRPSGSGSIEEQTEQALENLNAILTAGGSSLDQVLKTTIYISDIAHWDKVDAIYSRFFGEHRPARAVVPTRALHFGYQIEIDAVAAVK